jgi:hypothetical protein
MSNSNKKSANKNRVAIVTGSATGIGYEIALHLAIISHAIYDCIHKSLREEFSQMELDPAVWKYSDRVSTRSLEIYHKLKFKTIEFPVIGLHTP